MFTENRNALSMAVANTCANQEKRVPLPMKPGGKQRKPPRLGKKSTSDLFIVE
jgi:hypothetical protein